jgi:RNA polymerase sigma-70 factor (ECF subfamily)
VDYFALSDEELVALLAARDVTALDTLYGRHARATFALALKLLGDRELAEEVVQESFLTLWRRSDAFVPQRGRFLPWLLGVTHHRAVDVLRHRQLEARRRVDADVVQVVDASVGADPEACAWDQARAEAVGRALATLPQEQRRALELAYYGGLSQSEIARALREPLGTVKTRIRLGMQKLRDSIEMQRLRVDER